MSIRTEKVQIAVKGAEKPMPAYLAIPEGAGPFPAVLVIEEIFGINSHIRDITERVAREGYVAIAPDIHHRVAAGQELKYDEEGMKKGMALIPHLTADGLKADLDGTLAFVRARKDVKGDKIGVMGFCIGGHVAYLAGATTDVKATVSFYGGGIATFGPGGGPPTVTRTSGIKGSILCFFGGKDGAIPPEQVDTIRKELEKHHIRHEIVVYPEATHGFFCDQRGSFHPPSRDDAWNRVKKYFAAELR
jgi:carboxymethylenebutenolidase